MFAKYAVVLTTAASILGSFGAIAEAKSVKWSCVPVDPATPWIQICHASTSRP